MTDTITLNGRFLAQPVSGVQRYAREVAAALDRALAGGGTSASVAAPEGAAPLVLPNLPTRPVPGGSGHAWEQTRLPGAVRGRLLSLGNTGPLSVADQVVCMHDANVFEAPESYGLAFRAAYRVLQPALARRVARVATVSRSSAEQLARHLPLRASDVAVLPNGHEHALAWDPARSTLAPDAVPVRPYVLAIGSRARHKNAALLARIAPDLDALGVDVVVAGGAAGVFAPEDLASAPNLRTLGRVSDDDLAALMAGALCLAFPSWTEGFGLPIVEAMARGCPVVSSDRASMPEVCGAAALLAGPDDPAAWVDAVGRLARSEALRADLAAAGRERVARFSWDRTAEGYLSLAHAPTCRLPPPGAAAAPMPSVAVAVATLGRPEVVGATVRHLLATQTLRPSAVIVSCVRGSDAGDAAAIPGVTVLTGPAGLPAQRNAALDALPPGTDVVAFFDDDFVADPGWLEAAARAFRDEPDLVSFTGHVVVDDVKGPGLAFEDAVRIVGSFPPPPAPAWVEPFSPYGCNMAFRTAAIGDHRFDQRLVLYGWLEDRDFGAGLVRRGGRSAMSGAATGVHMGVKGGRVSGLRFGYSQVVNPVYMMRKGTMTPRQVAGQIFRNVASNLRGSLRPEPFVDRRGRLRGNVSGALDVIRGRLTPERAAAIGRTKE